MTAGRRTHQVIPCQPGEKPTKRCNGPKHNGEFLPVEAFGVRTQKNRQGNFYRSARCFECSAVYGRELYHQKTAPTAPAAPAPISPPPRHAMERGPGGEVSVMGPGGEVPSPGGEGHAYTAAGTRITRAWMSRYWLALYDEDNVRHVEPALPDRVQQLTAAGVLVEPLEQGRIR